MSRVATPQHPRWPAAATLLVVISVLVPATLARASAVPTTEIVPLDIAATLARLHETSTSRKTRRSLRLHAALRQTCASAGRGNEADKLMFNYRADRAKFHRQTSGDEDELLIAARTRCGHVAATRRRDANAVSEIASSGVKRVPNLTDWTGTILPERRARCSSSNFVRLPGENHSGRAGLAKSTAECTALSSPVRSYAAGEREVEAQLRIMLQRAVRYHNVMQL
jgi:hypothetical protein